MPAKVGELAGKAIRPTLLLALRTAASARSSPIGYPAGMGPVGWITGFPGPPYGSSAKVVGGGMKVRSLKVFLHGHYGISEPRRIRGASQ